MTILVVDGHSRIYRRHGTLRVADAEGNSIEEAIPDLDLVVAIGRRIVITTSAILLLSTHNIPVAFVDPRSSNVAVLFDPIQVSDTTARMAQYICINTPPCQLRYARGLVKAKLQGMSNMLRFEAKLRGSNSEYLRVAADTIASYAEYLSTISTPDDVRQVEAEASQRAWKAIASIIPEEYGFTGRKPRAGDPVNQAVSYTYAILYAIATKSLSVAGLDPFAGFLHTHRPGKTSLTYDFTEIYKPLAIHAVLKTINRRKLKQQKDRLTPETIEALTLHLYAALRRLSEKYHKRKNIWAHPIREAHKLATTLKTNTEYTPYTYDPRKQ